MFVTFNWKDTIAKMSEKANSRKRMELSESGTLLCSSLNLQKPKDRKCFSKYLEREGLL